MAVTRVAYTVDGWGEGELWFEGDVLVWHELPHPRPDAASAGEKRPRRERRPTQSPHPGGESTRRPLEATVARKGARVSTEIGSKPRAVLDRVERYFDGDAVDFADVRIALDGATIFQGAIAEALRHVPYGEVVSYRELAEAAGYPNAQRATGTFCAHNRFPLVLPCHRVVAANGLGPYGSLGSEYKRRLLELEGVTL